MHRNPAATAISLPARLAHLPDPGYWFSLATGDALIVMLNVHAMTPAKPVAPEDWTLGPEQFLWLARTLAEPSRLAQRASRGRLRPTRRPAQGDEPVAPLSEEVTT